MAGPSGSPLVSCIVPAFNSERYLAEALDSILAQRYRALETIVVDDGSTDGTAAVAGRYGDQVRCVRQPRAGPAATRNLGLSVARGEFVAFLDADDLWHPDKLARQMARFRARPELDLCITHIRMFWAPELDAEAEHYRDHPRARPIPGYSTPTLLARRAVFDRVGPFRTELSFADATDWFLRAAERGTLLELLPDVLVYHRMHSSNHTRLRDSHSRDEFVKLVKAFLDRKRRQPDSAAQS